MRKIRVLFHGSCWPTNIGNAFIGLGTIHSLKSALRKDENVFHVGGMSGYLFNKKGKLANSLPFEKIVDCDYLVHAGMTMCYDLVSNIQMYQEYAKRGTKIIFVGSGAAQYTNKEVKIVREAMKKFPVYGFISRDRYAFEKYGDLAKHSYDGIDSSFFIADCFQPPPLNLPEFDVMTFDEFNEPHINHEERFVIRTHHSCWPSSLKPKYFKHAYTLISDLPSDYLALYARAKITYSDRVHACVPALAFGRWARMYFKDGDGRIRMFQRLGVPEIYRMPVRLDSERLIKEKKNQIRFLRTILLAKRDKEIHTKNTHCSMCHVPQSLGSRQYKALCLHYLHKAQDIIRREKGWWELIREGANFLKRFFRKIRF